MKSSFSSAVDLMTSVYGLPMYEIERALKRAQTINGIVVLDPIYLFSSRRNATISSVFPKTIVMTGSTSG